MTPTGRLAHNEGALDMASSEVASDRPSPLPAARPLPALDLALACSLALVVLLLGWTQMAPGVVGAYHDDGVYVSTAHSLAAGQGYRLISLPGQPWQTKYPVLYPALLATVWKSWPTFPDNVVVMQWLTLTAAALSVALGYLYLTKFGYASRFVAGSSVALCATVPLYLYFSIQPMSEAVFGLLTVVVLWRCEAKLRDTGGAFGEGWTGIMLALLAMCRLIGMALVIPVLVTYFRRRKRFLRTALVVAVALGAWVAWVVLAGSPSNPTTAYYTDYGTSARALFGPFGWRIVALNGLATAVSSVGLALGGLRAGPALAGQIAIEGFVVCGVVGWVGIVSGIRRATLLPVCLTAYAMVALVWPWQPARLLVPLLPILTSVIVQTIGGRWFSAHTSGGRLARAAWVAVVLGALAGNVSSDIHIAGLNREFHYPVPPVARVLAGGDSEARPASWSDYQATFAWVRNHTEADDVLASGFDTMLFLYTGRHAYRPVLYRPEVLYGSPVSPIGTPDQIRALLERGHARYLVLLPGYEYASALRHAVDHLQATNPGLLQVVYRGRDERFVVFAVGTATGGAAG